MKTPLIPFGTKVKVSAYYHRSKGAGYKWEAIGFHHTGIVIGKRKLANGVVRYYDRFGEPCSRYDAVERYFEPREYVDAYLVAFPNRNPMYIPMDYIEAVEA